MNIVLCLILLSSCILFKDQKRYEKTFEVVDGQCFNIEAMLEHHENINVQNESGITPLLYAAKSESYPEASIEIVKLLEAGADPSVEELCYGNNSKECLNWRQYRAYALVLQAESWGDYAMNCLEDMGELYKMESRSASFKIVESFYINLFLLSWGYSLNQDGGYICKQDANEHHTVHWLKSRVTKDIPEDLKKFLEEAIQKAKSVKQTSESNSIFEFIEMRLGSESSAVNWFYSSYVLKKTDLNRFWKSN